MSIFALYNKYTIMTNLIDKVRVKQGRLIKVWNQNRKSAAKPIYVSVWVENADGSNERCLLFTEKELARAEDRAIKNMEDFTSKNFITDFLD